MSCLHICQINSTQPLRICLKNYGQHPGTTKSNTVVLFFGWLQEFWWRGASACVVPLIIGFSAGQLDLAQLIPAIGTEAQAQYNQTVDVESLVFADDWVAYESVEISFYGDSSDEF